MTLHQVVRPGREVRPRSSTRRRQVAGRAVRSSSLYLRLVRAGRCSSWRLVLGGVAVATRIAAARIPPGRRSASPARSSCSSLIAQLVNFAGGHRPHARRLPRGDRLPGLCRRRAHRGALAGRGRPIRMASSSGAGLATRAAAGRASGCPRAATPSSTRPGSRPLQLDADFAKTRSDFHGDGPRPLRRRLPGWLGITLFVVARRAWPWPGVCAARKSLGWAATVARSGRGGADLLHPATRSP